MNLHFFQWMPQHNNCNNDAQHHPCILFLHGMGGTGQIWRPIAASLEENLICIAPDQRGHGKSRPVPEHEENLFHASDYAKDLISLIESAILPLRPTSLYIVGHSMGVRSGLATAHAILQSKPSIQALFRGLISVDIGLQSKWGGGIGIPLANFIQALPETFPDRITMREYLFSHCPDPAIAQYLSAVSKKISDSPESWAFPFEHSALVKTIHQADEAPIEQWVTEICEAGVPVLALRGVHSKVWLKDDYEKSKIKLKHPHLSFEEWNNCGHGLPFEQRPLFIERIRRFIQEHP